MIAETITIQGHNNDVIHAEVARPLGSRLLLLSMGMYRQEQATDGWNKVWAFFEKDLEPPKYA